MDQQWAAPDHFTIKIIGKGVTEPHPTKQWTAIVTACQVVSALQTLVSRRINPLDPAVLTIGTIKGGSAFNIIADQVELTGTVRTFDLNLRKTIPGLMEQVIKGVCSAFGADYRFQYEEFFPPTINDHQMTALAEQAAVKIVGRQNTIVETKPSMEGEDFAFFLQEVPGSYIKVGINNPDKVPSMPFTIQVRFGLRLSPFSLQPCWAR